MQILGLIVAFANIYRDFLDQVKSMPRNITPIPTKDQKRGTSPKRKNATIDDKTGSKSIRVDNKVGETNLTT